MGKPKTVLSLQAHPDDAEFGCAGTLALLKERGWKVQIASMTPGDCGSAGPDSEQISRIRRQEASRSAGILGGSYHCLEEHDVFIMYDRQTLLKVIRLMRMLRPAVVFAPSPSDYMVDHEITARLAQAACFACGMQNIRIDGAEPFEPVPYLYYVDPMEGKDNTGRLIRPAFYVDIGGVIEIKKEMLACHESQRNWLRVHHGMDEYLLSMERFARSRGGETGTSFAEGFRQHLGHGFPQDNLLKAVLGDLVHE